MNECMYIEVYSRGSYLERTFSITWESPYKKKKCSGSSTIHEEMKPPGYGQWYEIRTCNNV